MHMTFAPYRHFKFAFSDVHFRGEILKSKLVFWKLRWPNREFTDHSADMFPDHVSMKMFEYIVWDNGITTLLF